LGSSNAPTKYNCFDYREGQTIVGGAAFDDDGMVTQSPAPIFSLFGDHKQGKSLLWNKELVAAAFTMGEAIQCGFTGADSDILAITSNSVAFLILDGTSGSTLSAKKLQIGGSTVSYL